MSLARYDWAIRVSHSDTGESVTITSRDFRSMHKAKIAAQKILRGRIYARKMGYENAAEVAVYDLPDGEEYPHELIDYRLLT